MKRLGIALAAGLIAGGAAALAAGVMFESSTLVGTWGVFYGIVLGTIAFLIALARGRGWPAIAARCLLVLGLAFVSWWAVFFAIGTSPVSRDGALLWPLAVFCIGALAVAARWAWRSTRKTAESRPSVENG